METPFRYLGWKTLFKGLTVNIASQNFAAGKGSMYLTYSREFVAWCEAMHIRDITEVRSQHLTTYLAYLEERPNQRRGGTLSASSIAHHLFSVRLLFDYAYASGIIGYTVPFPKFIVPERSAKDVPTPDEIRELFAVCQDPRDKAILTLAYGCGLRRNELFWLDTADVLTHTGTLYVREGKGRKSRSIPLTNKSVAYLRSYERNHRPKLLRERTDDTPEPAYLLNHKGHRLNHNTIYKRVTELAARTEDPVLIQKNVTPHLLRHAVATHLTENGADLKWVQAFLGHGDIDSTHWYIRTRKTRLTHQA